MEREKLLNQSSIILLGRKQLWASADGSNMKQESEDHMDWPHALFILSYSSKTWWSRRSKSKRRMLSKLREKIQRGLHVQKTKRSQKVLKLIYQSKKEPLRSRVSRCHLETGAYSPKWPLVFENPASSSWDISVEFGGPTDCHSKSNVVSMAKNLEVINYPTDERDAGRKDLKKNT